MQVGLHAEREGVLTTADAEGPDELWRVIWWRWDWNRVVQPLLACSVLYSRLVL